MGVSCYDDGGHKRNKINHQRFENSLNKNNNEQPKNKFNENNYSKIIGIRKMINYKNSDYKEKALQIHNEFRLKHKSKNLVLNIELCNMAKNYAEKCAESNDIINCTDLYNDDIIGQNIYISNENLLDVEEICKQWYNEKFDYKFNSNKYIKDTGHFTQLVWKSTELVGFGYSTDEKGKIYFVANYYPAGNIFNEFDKNVQEEIN